MMENCSYFEATGALERFKEPNIRFLNKQQEKTLWTSLADHLLKFELLPAVAFIFSRQRCDTNADILSHLDLTTQREKSYIHQFFTKCVRYVSARAAVRL